MRIRPFLKWAGGKRWLTDREDFQLPEFSGRYIEPFLGGGAMFFDTAPKLAVLSDSNARLIETYVAVRDDLESLLRHLREHSKNHSKEFYYQIRNAQLSSASERAAQFIYLNRSCWNGLYRVNKAGAFNVPIGTKNWIISANDQFFEISEALRSATIRCSDFEKTIDSARRNDLLFIDPPYTTAHNFNGFVKYNSTIFSWDDQIRLKNAISRAITRGAKIVMTNANHESITDLYRDLGTAGVLERHSVISGSSSARQRTTEALFVFK